MASEQHQKQIVFWKKHQALLQNCADLSSKCGAKILVNWCFSSCPCVNGSDIRFSCLLQCIITIPAMRPHSFARTRPLKPRMGEEGTRPVGLRWAMGWRGGRRRAMAGLRCKSPAATATIVCFARVRRAPDLARAGLGRSRPRGPASRGDVRPLASNKSLTVSSAAAGHSMVCARGRARRRRRATAGHAPT